MKYLRYIIIILSALVIAKFAADKYISREIVIFYSLVFGFIFFKIISWEVRFYIFSLLIFFTFRMPQEITLPLKWWSEIYALLLFCLLFFETLINKKPLISSNGRIFFIALGVLVLYCILHYIMNPVGGKSFGSSEEGIGLRSYAQIVTGACTFLSAFWLVRYKKINFERLLIFMLIVSMVVSIMRVLGFSVPILGAAFIEYDYEKDILTQGKWDVTTGLRLTAMVGMASTLGLYHKKKGGFLPVMAVLFFLIFSVMAAGRGIFYGLLLAIGLYATIVNRKLIIPVISLAIIIGGIFHILLADVDISQLRYGRVFSVEGGVEKQDKGRYYNFLYMMEVIKKNPILGKGIGYQPISFSDEFFLKYGEEALDYKATIEAAIRAGSHGSYLSIASTFGIGGIFYLFVMIYGTMYYSYKTAIRNDIDVDECRMALFVFIYATVNAVHMINGGDGTNYRDMWFIPGVCAGIMARHQGETEDKDFSFQ